jgi:hypothetical protein
MKNIFLILLVSFLYNGFSQVNVNLSKVKLFGSLALLTYEGEVTLEKGENDIKIKGISTSIDYSRLILKKTKDYYINTTSYKYDIRSAYSKQIQNSELEITNFNKELKDIYIKNKSINEQLNILYVNKELKENLDVESLNSLLAFNYQMQTKLRHDLLEIEERKKLLMKK